MGIRRWIALLLSALLLFSLVPVSAESGGSFVLTAATSSQVLIAPTKVSYAPGQTIRQALDASGYRFSGDGGSIQEIEGVVGNYTRYYDGGAYDLDAVASPKTITALIFSERADASGYSQALLDLTLDLAALTERTDAVLKDAAVKSARDQALAALPTADEAQAKERLATLRQAVADFDAAQAGPRYTLTFDIPGAASIALTDPYGDTALLSGTSAEVLAGTYTFLASDGGNNRVEGSVTVSESRTVTAALPQGNWFGAVRLLRTAGSGSAAYAAQGSTYYIEDSCTNAYLYAELGADAPATRPGLYSCYTGLDGVDYGDGAVPDNRKSWESYKTNLISLLDESMTGRSFTLEARLVDENGYTMVQSYPMTVTRVPTLANLRILDSGTALPLDFDGTVTDYTVTALSDTLTAEAAPFGSSGYTVTYNGGADSTVPAKDFTVTVSHEDGQSRTYSVHVNKAQAVNVTLRLPSGVTAQVKNAAGSVLSPVSGSTYRLVPGERYTYEATVSTYFHTSAAFTAAEGLTVEVARPETGHRLSSLGAYSARNISKARTYELSPAFSTETHTYFITVPDYGSAPFLAADVSDSGYSITAIYAKHSASLSSDGKETSVSIPAGSSSATLCTQALLPSGDSNEMTLRLSRQSGDVTYYQDYTLTLRRQLSLKSLALANSGNTQPLLDASGSSVKFNRDTREYWIKVLNSTERLTLSAEFVSDASSTPHSGGYWAQVSGQRVEDLSKLEVALDPMQDQEDIVITVYHRDENALAGRYTVHVKKLPPVAVTFRVTPKDATVFLSSDQTGQAVSRQADGSFLLIPGDSYSYTVTRSGYVGQEKTGYLAPESAATVSVTLTQAKENTRLQDLPAQWPGFRADDYNNGVVDAPTPTQAENATLYWATQLGEGYGSEACGCPILVDGYLYVYAGSNLYKVDKTSGQVVATGKMDHNSSFAINSPTYADGMIFVGLANGCVQAFDAVTLESLWIYRDPLGGQPNCPLVYHDGYLYTGFWNSEVGDANFVCLSVTDEDPDSPTERKLSTWRYTSPGGFYWAGAYVCDGYVLVGTDDGKAGYTTGYGRFLSLDPLTGQLLDSIGLPNPGDARSSVTFVPEKQGAGSAYFTTKGGYFYTVHVEADGRFTSGSFRGLQLYNYADDAANPPMSTSTPTIYNGRAYVGVSGVGQFSPYSGHNITVIDLAGLSIAYTVRTQGYPQSSGLLTTAYEEEEGAVYVYFFDNYLPGKLRILRDRPGQTEPDLLTQETAFVGGKEVTYDTPAVLFTPDGAQAQYAICSPIVDEDGVIYFKNDSAYLMALGPTIDALDVSAPTKTAYHEDETFDPAGLSVTARYSNGTSRDVTDYVTWSPDPLTPDDSQFQIVFPYTMYGNRDGKAGQTYYAPTGAAELTVTAHEYTKLETGSQGHRHVCAICGKTQEDWQAHSYTSQVTNPTCTEKGYTTYTCTVCNYSYRGNETAALGHSYQNGVCTRCGAKDPNAVTPISNPFVDVGQKDYYYDAVLWAVGHEVTAGTDATHFSPNASCTRAQVVSFLWRAAGKPEPTSSKNPFVDVSSDSYYYKAVLWAAENGIVYGTDATHFSPNASCTRAQVVCFLYRYQGNPAHGSGNPFRDVSGGAYYYDAVLWAEQNGVVYGTDASHFSPNKTCTRGQVVCFLYRLLK